MIGESLAAKIQIGQITLSGGIVLKEGNAPSFPPDTGYGVLYEKTDGKLYFKNDEGTEYDLTATDSGSGDVSGPASSTDNAIARFDGATGKILQNSGVLISDGGDILLDGDNKVVFSEYGQVHWISGDLWIRNTYSTEPYTGSINFMIGESLAAKIQIGQITLSGGIVLKEGNAPSFPPDTGYGVLYEKTDGKLYFKNDEGTEYDLTATYSGSGDVSGPASSTDNAIARFDGATGKILQNSGVLISDGGDMSFGSGVKALFGSTGEIYETGGGLRLRNSAEEGVIDFVINASAKAVLGTSGLQLNGRLTLVETTSPTTPASGYGILFPKTDGKLYFKNDEGTEYDLTATYSGSGDVSGPASSTDNAIARFDGATGKILQNSGVLISDGGDMSFGSGVKALFGSTGEIYETGGGLRLRNSAEEGVIDFVINASAKAVLGTSGLQLNGRLTLVETTSPTTPASGYGILFPKTDGKLYFKNDEGTEYDLTATYSGSGDVSGPASSTDNAIARFDGATGKILQNSGVLISDGGDMSFGSGVKALFGSTGEIYETGGGLRLRNSAEEGVIDFVINASAKAVLGTSGLQLNGRLTLVETTSPTTPASGYGILFPKTDGKLYFKNDEGTEYDLTATGGSYPSAGIVVSTGSAWGTSIGNSAGLAGALSDETGFSTGAKAVFSINPSLAGMTVTDNIHINDNKAVLFGSADDSGIWWNDSHQMLYVYSGTAMTIESDTVMLIMNNSQLDIVDGYIVLHRMASPGKASANTARLFLDSSGNLCYTSDGSAEIRTIDFKITVPL
jgi:hypothetical protein